MGDIAVPGEAKLIDSVKKAFADGRFVLVDIEPAKLETVMEFRFREVFDDLIPPSSGIRLFRGACTVKVIWNSRNYAITTVRSKVTSGKKPDEVRSRIAAYLADEAVETAATLLEPLVE